MEQDARAIRALIRRVRINPIGLDWRRFIVAVDEHDHLLGCGQVKPHFDGSREMASLAVWPEQQHQGIGTAIVEYLLAENRPPLYLTCRSSIEDYYRKFGFQTVSPAEMPPYFRRIWRLFSLLRRILRLQEELRVMVKRA